MQTALFEVKNAISATAVSAVNLFASVDKSSFPFIADVPDTITVQLSDVYGVGVPGRGAGIMLYARRVVASIDLVNASLQFAEQWHSLSYLDRLKSMFTLLVQGGRRLSLIPYPAANVIVRHGLPVEGTSHPMCCFKLPVRAY